MNQRTDKNALQRELEAAGARIKGASVVCPFHEDKSPSGALFTDETGVWRYKCHAISCGFCGDIYDVRAKVTNRPVEDILKEANPAAPETKSPKVYATVEDIEATVPGLEQRYTYTNPETRRPDLVVLRYVEDGKKSFRQISPVPGGFIQRRPAGKLPLYNRIAMQDAEVVLVVEGEKCVHAVRNAGHVGTTSAGGAGKAAQTDWSPLAGKKVYLWPDNDESGIKHMRQVQSIIDKLEPAPVVFWIDPAGLFLPPKGDVVDYLEAFDRTIWHSAVIAASETAEPTGASQELWTILQETIDGKREAVDWPWPTMAKLTRALLPGTVTLVCGDPGAAKSFMLLQAVSFWRKQGRKVCIFELEEDRAYHLNRLLAQESEIADMFDPEWIRANPEQVREVYLANAHHLDEVGRCLYAAPDKQVTLNTLAQWTLERAKEGNRVIVIDPVTAALTDNKHTWVADSEFLFSVKAIVREYRSSLVLVTHPKKGRQSRVGMDELAGGAAYQRFAQTILWLEHLKEDHSVTVTSSMGRYETDINRRVNLMKTRNGRGAGSRLGFVFGGDTLKMAEQGLIISDEKGD